MSHKLLKVLDLSATAECPERLHELVINGLVEKFKFEQGKELELPYSIGIKFMQHGFVVRDAEDGHEISKPAVTDETIRIRISDDEVVAKYDELSVGALKLRAAGLSGGEKFLTGNAAKSEIILFLKGGSAPTDEVELEDDEDALEPVSTAEQPVEEEVIPVEEEVPETEAPETEAAEQPAQRRAGGRGKRG